MMTYDDNMKLKEYMKSELLGFFRVKVVAKNILLGSLGAQRQAVFAMCYLFLKKQTNVLNEFVTFKCFPCKTAH